jgi:hypothetical protein
MNWPICRVAAILCTFVLCSCRSAILPTSSTEGDSVITWVPSTPDEILPAPTETVSNPTENVTPSVLTPAPANLITNLRCNTYIEARWGTKPGEFGFCPASSRADERGPSYFPRLDAQGNVFVLDKVNWRVLRYTGGAAPQVIPIPASFTSHDPCEYSLYGWTYWNVSKDRLFFVFPSPKEGTRGGWLAILSLEDRKQQTIDLELYYPLHSPFANSLIPDRKGGGYLLLPPAGVVYFDADLRPEFVYLGAHSSLYENMAVGWDGNLYTYQIEDDILNSWGKDNQAFSHGESLGRMADVMSATQIISPTFTRLLGADTQVRLYFRTTERGSKRLFVRVSASGDQREVAMAPAEWQSSFYGSELAPDGSLYDIIYDSEDPSVNPRIVKCTFD